MSPPSSPAPRSGSPSAQAVASDPEVQAQIGLFSAWLDGQIEIRGLPGVVVGEVVRMITGDSYLVRIR